MALVSTQRNLFLAIFSFVLAVAFIVYHVGIDWFYCLSADDFAGIDYASEGIPGLSYAWRFYFGWEGPFLSMVIQGLLMSSVAAGMPPFVGLLVVKTALLLSTVVLLHAVSTRFTFEWSWKETWLVSLLFNLCLYLISPEPSEIWHWLIGTVYLVPLIFLQLGTAALLLNRFWLAIIPLAFVMQSRATYAVLIFGFIVLLTIFNWWIKAENKKQWLVLSAFLFLFLAIYLAAPGNYIRMTEHGNSTTFLINQFKIGLYNLFISYNIAKLDRVFLGLLAVLPVIGLSTFIPKPKLAWQWFIPAALYLGFVIAHEVLFVYITGWREWERVLALHSFLFLITAFVYGYWFYGFISHHWRTKLWPLSVVGIAGILIHLFAGFESELQKGAQLKASYEMRLERILAHQQTGDTLYVQPMNYQGVLFFKDFSEDIDSWINHDFVKAYGLDFKVALQETQQ